MFVKQGIFLCFCSRIRENFSFRGFIRVLKVDFSPVDVPFPRFHSWLVDVDCFVRMEISSNEDYIP